MIINHLHYLKYIFSNYLIMTLFVDNYSRLLCHMNPINIAMEAYMQVLQWMFKKSTIIYKTYMRILQWM
jgi:hypothetical protein